MMTCTYTYLNFSKNSEIHVDYFYHVFIFFVCFFIGDKVLTTPINLIIFFNFKLLYFVILLIPNPLNI